MALPTKAKTWQYLWNLAVGGTGSLATDGPSMLYNLSVQLLALRNAVDGSGNPSGATPIFICCGSSDRTNVAAASTTAQTNYWTGTTKVVFQAAGAVGSWIVLKNQGSGLTNPYYMLIQASNAGGGSLQNYSVTFSYAGFTGGSTTAVPTCTDTWSAPSNGLAATNSSVVNNGVMPGVTFTGKLHVIASIDGTSVRWALSSSGITQSMYHVEQPTSATSGWTNPLVVLCNSVASSNGYTANFATTANLFAASTFVGIRGNVNPAVPTLVTGFLTTEEYNGATLAGTTTVANDLDGTWPMCNIGVASFSTVGYRGRLGLMTDMWHGSSGVPDMSTYPADATRQFVQFQNIIWPNNGTAVVSS